jgi:precorrin-6B methylase 1
VTCAKNESDENSESYDIIPRISSAQLAATHFEGRCSHSMNEKRQLTNCGNMMTWQLGYSDKDFKAAIIKMTQHALMNMLNKQKKVKKIPRE